MTETRTLSYLTDGALAQRLLMLADDVRAFTPTERSAFLTEAALRLTALLRLRLADAQAVDGGVTDEAIMMIVEALGFVPDDVDPDRDVMVTLGDLLTYTELVLEAGRRLPRP